MGQVYGESKLEYPVVFGWSIKRKQFRAVIPGFRGVQAFGETLEQAHNNLKLLIDQCIQKGGRICQKL